MTWLASLSACALCSAADTWTSFHNGGNTSVAAGDLPVTWCADDGLSWVVELPGYGQSSPVVWRDRLYVTSVEGERKETNIVSAFQASTGEQLWRREFPASVTQQTSYMVSRAAPTPAVDARGLYVMFESGDLHALSHEGKPEWHVALFDDGERCFQNAHGYGASPAQTDEAVIVLIDHRGPSYVTALSKRTGEPLWKTDRPSRSSWTSPQVAHVGNQMQVIVSSGGSVDGYDAETGQRLWTHESVSGNLIPSPTVIGDRVFVGASVGRDETVSSSAAASNCCLRITPQIECGYEQIWQAKRAACHYVSPLVHRGHVYYVNSVGVLYCLNAATGRQVYVNRIDGPCWAQPIGVDERLYFFGKNGVTTVVRAGPTFEYITSNRLWTGDNPPRPGRSYEYEPDGPKDPRPRRPEQQYRDPIVYAVAAVDEAFFVRLGTHVYCIPASR